MHVRTIAIATTFTLAIATTGHAEKPKYNLIPLAGAKFEPINPKNPAGGQMAILSGNPKTGPVALLLKIPKGNSPLHWHTSAYHAITVEGKTKHWLAGKEAEATENPPGTFWLQPGGSAATSHGDACLSDTCTLFVYMTGKFDIKPAPAPKAPAPTKK